eukprot:Nk52_evm35s96 gene=Nk52_evmTU35s96
MQEELPDAKFSEEFGLFPEKRSVLLSTVIEGSLDYYRFNILHLQNRGDPTSLSKSRILLKAFQDAFPKAKEISTFRVRQCLLDYYSEDATVAREAYFDLISFCGVTFPKTGTSVKTAAVGRSESKIKFSGGFEMNTYIRDKLSAEGAANLNAISDIGLYFLHRFELSHSQIRSVLERTKYPMFNCLTDFVLDFLKSKNGKFGSIALHNEIPMSYMDKLRERDPSLLKNKEYVLAAIQKILSTPFYGEHEVEIDKCRYSSLYECTRFCMLLPKEFTPLCVSLCVQYLALGIKLERLDQDTFLNFIKLPYVHEQMEDMYAKRIGSDNSYVVTNLDMKRLNISVIDSHRHTGVIEKYLIMLFSKAECTGIEPYDQYLKEQWLVTLYMKTKHFLGGNVDPKYFHKIDPSALSEWAQEKVFRFSGRNKEEFTKDEIVEISLEIKSVGDVVVKVFHINEKNYYTKHLKEISLDIELTGIVPREEFVLEQKGQLDQLKKVTVPLPNLKGRGVFIVNFYGNKVNNRALIRKGSLNYIERSTLNGHSFIVYDELYNPILEDTSIVLGNQTLKCDENGVILVPYRNSTESVDELIVVNSKDLSILSRFHHKCGDISFSGRCFIPPEEFCYNKQWACALMFLSLKINGSSIPVSVIDKLSVHFSAYDMDGLKVVTRVEKSMAKRKSFKCKFDVFNVTSHIVVDYTAEVKINGEKSPPVILKYQEVIDIRRRSSMFRIQDYYFLPSERSVFEIGLGGEMATRTKREFGVEHSYFRDPVPIELLAGSSGGYFFDDLANCSSISVEEPKGRKLRIPQSYSSTYAENLYFVVDESISLPLEQEKRYVNMTDFSFFEMAKSVDGRAYVYADAHTRLSVYNGYLVIDSSEPGYFILRDHRKNSLKHIHIIRGKPVDDGSFILHKFGRIDRSEQCIPKRIMHDVTSFHDRIVIKIDNCDEDTEVHAICCAFSSQVDPAEIASFDIDAKDDCAKETFMSRDSHLSEYSQKYISDTEMYCMNRKYAEKYVGNFLSIPSLLCKEKELCSVEMGLEDKVGAGMGRKFKKMADCGLKPTAAMFCGPVQDDSSLNYPSYDFLKYGASIMSDIKLDENGEFTIANSNLHALGHSAIYIIVKSGNSVSAATVLKSSANIIFSDASSEKITTDQDAHYLLKERIDVIEKGGYKKTFGVPKAPRFSFFNSLEQVGNFLISVCDSPNEKQSRTVEALLGWCDLTYAEKCETYSNIACHEVNFFLSKKDKNFFEKIVRPFVEQKIQKSFVDRFLLEEDLSHFLASYELSKLCDFEKIILARWAGEKSLLLESLKQKGKEYKVSLKEKADMFNQAVDFRDLLDENSLDTLRTYGDGMRVTNPESEDLSENVFLEEEEAEEEFAETTYEFSNSSARGASSAKKIASSKRVPESRPSPKRPVPLGRISNTNKIGKRPRKMFVENETVKSCSETYWGDEQAIYFVEISSFWLDYLQWDGDGHFLSPNFIYCKRDLSEIILSLAVLSLDFQTSRPCVFDVSGDSLTVETHTHGVLLVEELCNSETKRDEDIAVFQDYFVPEETSQSSVSKKEEFVDNFLVGKIYGCRVTVMNMSREEQLFSLFVCKPDKSVPLKGFRNGQLKYLEVKAKSIGTFTFYFYFPKYIGDAFHYPVQVGRGDCVIAWPPKRSLLVETAEESSDPSMALERMIAGGDCDNILQLLKTSDLRSIDLSVISTRVLMQKEFFKELIQILRDRMVYDPYIWKFSFVHREMKGIGEYLLAQNDKTRVLLRVGKYFKCNFMQYSALDSLDFLHLEYLPFVHVRYHPLDRQSTLFNSSISDKYADLVDLLKYMPEFDVRCNLVISYHLILQGRFSLAQSFFMQAETLCAKEKSESFKVSRDYFRVYFAFFKEDKDKLEEARATCMQYVNYPIRKFGKLFGNALRQLNQILSTDDKINQWSSKEFSSEEVGTEASVDIAVKGEHLAVHYFGFPKESDLKTWIKYYKVDIESMFSANPFSSKRIEMFSCVKENSMVSFGDEHAISSSAGKLKIEIQKEYANSNVVVEFGCELASAWTLYFSNAIAVPINERLGELKVFRKETGKCLPGVYIKVYAQAGNSGDVHFYKDGFTDLRGCFDYVSLNNDFVDKVTLFSILVLSEECGSMIKEVRPFAKIK